LFPADRLFSDPDRSEEIGVDGHAATGELRPAFASNPLKLARNIKRLIRKLSNNPSLSGISILAGGGTKVTTGGHIHFGIPNMPGELREILWKLVAAPMLKLQGKLRNTDTSKCRKQGSDIVRLQQWGMEWRPLPSFIVNEDLTQAVLVTTYAIVKSFYMRELNTSGSIKNSLIRLPLYPIYKEYIDKFIDILAVESTLLENRDVVREWKLEKLNRNPSVVVTCTNSELGKLFTPLYVSLKQPIRIQVSFGQGQNLELWNLPPSARENFKKFAESHFMGCTIDGELSPNREESHRHGQQGARTNRVPQPPTERESRRDYAWDFEIYLPYSWAPREGFSVTEKLFLQIKDLIRDAVIELNTIR
jgi:hypothetical protein